MIELSLVMASLTLMTAMDSTSASERIRPEDVNYRNYEVFVDEIRSDLPAGTPKDEVQSYLLDRGIGFGNAKDEDVRVSPPRVEHYIVFLIRGIRKMFIFGHTDLQVRIYLSEEGRVSRIEPIIIRTAP